MSRGQLMPAANLCKEAVRFTGGPSVAHCWQLMISFSISINLPVDHLPTTQIACRRWPNIGMSVSPTLAATVSPIYGFLAGRSMSVWQATDNILLPLQHQPIRLQHGVMWPLFNRKQIIDRLWVDFS